MHIRPLLAGSLLAATALPAGAADFQTFKPHDFRPAIHDWTGGYAGVHGGWGWGRFRGSFVASGIPESGDPYSFARTGATDADGFVAGVQSGYGIQLDPLYFGLEADLSYARIDGGRTWPFTVENVEIEVGVPEPVNMAMTITGRTEWLGTFRGRVGLPLDNVLIYGTAGLAVGGVRVEGFGGSDRSERFGWTGGGGIEVAFDGWSLRGEYLYYDLGKKSFSGQGDKSYSLSGTLPSPVGGPINVAGDVKFAGHVMRAALNYHFGK